MDTIAHRTPAGEPPTLHVEPQIKLQAANSVEVTVYTTSLNA